MSTFNQRLARHNRFRLRATALSQRAVDVIDQPGQFLRALRIHDRATRAARSADEALRTLSPSACLQIAERFGRSARR